MLKWEKMRCMDTGVMGYTSTNALSGSFWIEKGIGGKGFSLYYQGTLVKLYNEDLSSAKREAETYSKKIGIS